MLEKQQNEVSRLAARLRVQRLRCAHAKAQLAHERQSLFKRPVALILPFGAGAVTAWLLTRPAPRREARRADPVMSITTLISAASAFWSATRSLREELGLHSAGLLQAVQRKTRREGVSER